jgi:hypothetical protein
MTDWRSKVTLSQRDGVKAAAVILGLLFLCIFVLWVAMRFLRPDAPPHTIMPERPPIPMPTPRPGP